MFWGSNSVPQTCKASTLTTSLYLHLDRLFLSEDPTRLLPYFNRPLQWEMRLFAYLGVSPSFRNTRTNYSEMHCSKIGKELWRILHIIQWMSKKKLYNMMADDIIWVPLTQQVVIAIKLVLTVGTVLIWVPGNKNLSLFSRQGRTGMNSKIIQEK